MNLPGIVISLPATVKENPLRGIFYICIPMLLLIPLMNTFAKLLTNDFHITQVVWARFFGHLLCMTLLFWPSRGWRLYRTRRPALQFLRSLLMFISNSCFITGLSIVALATASAIMMTTPLIVTLLAILLLGERVGLHRRIAVAIGLLGALIIIRPTADFDNIGNLLILGSATTFGIYQILTRKLTTDDPPDTMIVYTALVAGLIMTLIVPFYFTWPTTLLQWVLLIAIGITGAFAQFFVVKAVQYAPVSVVSPFQYTELIGAIIFGLAIFGTFPDAWTWLGAAIIVMCGLYIAYREKRRGA